MSLESVRHFLKTHAPDLELIETSEVTHTVQMAADVLKVEPAQIAKTLALKADDKFIILVTSGIRKLDNGKFKSQFGTKPRMLSAEETQTLTGHPVGGVTPIGLANDLPVYLDRSLEEFDYVYPAGGSPNSALKITPQRLAELSRGSWIDVTKLPE